MEMVSVSGTGCSICDTIISFLDMLVNEKTTEEEVRNGLEKFCGLLKSSEVTHTVLVFTALTVCPLTLYMHGALSVPFPVLIKLPLPVNVCVPTG